jgi:malic enzyme
MEGKGNLFKQFADLDVFDLEVGSEDPQDVIRFCQLLEPTVGGINLEDIRAPDCFLIEETLRKTLTIPVFHDDQHGTAIISGAALVNALEIVGKRIEDVRVVFSGAGAAALATAAHYERLGVRREHIIMCDRAGVIYTGRSSDMDPYKSRFANDTSARTLAEALDGADVFVGLSVAGAATGDMIAKMAPNPLIFALANPVPEILPDEVRAVRSDAIVATGRSDYPNQVNNVLGFPFIFRGAMDARATEVNEEMKMAATRALAALAKEEVPESVSALYGLRSVKFGPDYLIPFAFDPRVLLWIAPAVAWAAVASGVAKTFVDVEEYRDQLEARLGRARGIIRGIVNRAVRDPKRILFPEEKSGRSCAPRGSSSTTASAIRFSSGTARSSSDRGVGCHIARRAPDRGSSHLTQPRAIRRVSLGAPAAKRDEYRRGTPAPVQRELLWVRNGRVRRRRRTVIGHDHAVLRDDSPRPRGGRRASTSRARERHVHAGLRQARGVLRRYDGKHQSIGRAARPDCVFCGEDRSDVRDRASRRDAELLELRLRAASGRRKGLAGGPVGPAARSKPGRGRRNAG